MRVAPIKAIIPRAIAVRRSLIPLIFDSSPRGQLWFWVGLLTIGLTLHLLLIMVAFSVSPSKSKPLPTMEVSLFSEPPKKFIKEEPPPKEAKAEPVDQSPKREESKEMTPAKKSPREPPPDLRARAGKVLATNLEAVNTSKDDDAIVTGEAESYAGGLTASSGTSEEAVEPTPTPEPPQKAAPASKKIDTIAITRTYLKQIRDALLREKRYPLAAQRIGIEGVSVVSFVIGADGFFKNITIASSSGSELLDRAAIETVASLSGKIARPKEIGVLELPLKTAIRFEIEQ